MAARSGLGHHGPRGRTQWAIEGAWPASVLAGLVQAVEAVDVTLDQMVQNSGFLKDLYASPEPKFLIS